MARLRKIANQQANAEYNPTIRRTRREGRAAVQGVRSMQDPLEQGLRNTSRSLRHAGLAPRDLQLALQSLANQQGQVGASVAMQIGQAQRETQAQLVDLRQAREQAASSSLLSMRQDRADQEREAEQDIVGEQREMANAIRQKQLEQQLGLTDGGSDGGLTPTQRREYKDGLSNAHFYAKNFFQKARDEGDDPKSWDENVWRELVEATAATAKVDIPVAERSVQAIRAHVDPGSIPAERPTGPPETAMQAIAQAAGQATGRAIANPLAALAALLQQAGRR